MERMFGTSRSFKSTKCKTHLKLVVSRIKLLRNKREVQVKHLKRDVAQLLQNKQDANARTRVDYALREQNMVDAYGIIETYCEFLATRLPSISTQKLCPPDLQEAIASLIYAGPRCADLPELLEIRSIFSSKYGKEFVAKILELRAGCGVSQRIIEKLSSQPLSSATKMKFMTEVAKEFNVKWEPLDLAADEVKQTPVRQPEARLKGPSHFTSAIHLDKRGPDNESPKSPLEKTPPHSVHSVGAGYDANSEPEDFEEELPSRAPVAAKPSVPAPVVIKPSVPAPVVAKPSVQAPVVVKPSVPSEETIPQGGKQFIPFLMPYSAKESSSHNNQSSKQPEVDPYIRYTRTSMNPYAAAVQEADKSAPAGQVDPYLEHKKNLAGAFTDVAAASQVAAESADQAAAAARVAANLAQKRLSRESSSSRMSKDDPVRARNLGKALETKVSVVSLEERVSSYLNSHANDEDSSEWESPVPREQASQDINPSRNLWSEFRNSPVPERQAQDDDQQFENRTERHHSARNMVAKESKEDNKIDKRGNMWTKDNRTASASNMANKEDNKLDKRYSTGNMVTKDNRTDSTSNMANKEDGIDKRYSTGNMAAKGTRETFEEDNNLFRSEEFETNEPADLKPFGKPVFDDGGTESSDMFQDSLLSGKWHTERRHVMQEEGYDHLDRRGKSLFDENPRYSIERREEAHDDLDGNGKPVFDEHPGFSRQDSITVNLQTMHESILSRTEALFEKEDYDSDEVTRPRRNRGDGRVSSSSKQDGGWTAGEVHKQRYDEQEKVQERTSTQEWSGWRLSHTTKQDHSPPKLHLDPSERQGSSRLDIQKQFHGATVDDRENLSLGGGAASVRKHRVGASVRTKRT